MKGICAAGLNLWTFTLLGLAQCREDIAPNLDYELDRHAEREGGRMVSILVWMTSNSPISIPSTGSSRPMSLRLAGPAVRFRMQGDFSFRPRAPGEPAPMMPTVCASTLAGSGFHRSGSPNQGQDGASGDIMAGC
jgi:hypothetical protein